MKAYFPEKIRKVSLICRLLNVQREVKVKKPLDSIKGSPWVPDFKSMTETPAPIGTGPQIGIFIGIYAGMFFRRIGDVETRLLPMSKQECCDDISR